MLNNGEIEILKLEVVNFTKRVFFSFLCLALTASSSSSSSVTSPSPGTILSSSASAMVTVTSNVDLDLDLDLVDKKKTCWFCLFLACLFLEIGSEIVFCLSNNLLQEILFYFFFKSIKNETTILNARLNATKALLLYDIIWLVKSYHCDITHLKKSG